MNYELAKQLKEAGYVYYQKRVMFNKYDKIYAPSSNGMLSSDYELVPTLSELIEACGDKFNNHYIGKNDNIFEVVELPLLDTCEIVIKEVGNSPEEAVAKLWLKLNNKTLERN